MLYCSQGLQDDFLQAELFHLPLDRLFCGYNKTLRVFDTARPGREFSQYSTLTNAKDGQTGSNLSFFSLKTESEALKSPFILL